jgi:hypothetical protein
MRKYGECSEKEGKFIEYKEAYVNRYYSLRSEADKS